MDFIKTFFTPFVPSGAATSFPIPPAASGYQGQSIFSSLATKLTLLTWFFFFALINCRLPSEFHVDGRRIWLGPWEHRFLWVQAAGLQSPQCGMWTLNEDYELYTYYSVRYVYFEQILWALHLFDIFLCFPSLLRLFSFLQIVRVNQTANSTITSLFFTFIL